jgi:hypothetical protein
MGRINSKARFERFNAYLTKTSQTETPRAGVRRSVVMRSSEN